MSEEGQEFSGRSIDEAVATGLQVLGLRSNQVRVEVIHKGSRGLFGIGSEPSLVRLIPIIEKPPASIESVQSRIVQSAEPIIEQAPVEIKAASNSIEAITSSDESTRTAALMPGPSDSTLETKSETSDPPDTVEDEAGTEAAAVEMLAKMVGLLGFKVTVEAIWKDGDDEHDKRVLWLEIHGANLSTLIGRRGETLENIQYLLRMMVNQRLHRWNDIVVDVDQYRIRRAEQISQMANRLADQAIGAGRAMALEPMPANERRIVHMALRDHPHVYTQSSGDGERRKVYIVPKS